VLLTFRRSPRPPAALPASGTEGTPGIRRITRLAYAALRSTAIRDQYGGATGHPATAFSMATVLDELALHAASLPDDLRAAITTAC
jgi:hypothetical protein